jgi:succinate dehydrogenase/fumarate reductase flavoprotein subunit
VRGAVLGTPEGNVEVRAARGVVLAAGGFAHDKARRQAMFPADEQNKTLAVPSATGDGLRLGESVGGSVDDTLASPGAWCPVSLVPFPDGTVGRFPHIIERNKPGIIGVLANGQRFCNEGTGYHDYVVAMLRSVPPGQEVASWLVCTRAFQRRYGLGIARPTPLPVGPYIRSGYIKTGRTIAELARACGIHPAGLERTIAEYNLHARNGEDPAFGRGSLPYNRQSGDPANKPNPCVAPIDQGPFFAVKVVPGSFGTFAGLKTDASARVLDRDGAPIPGLYAAGTDMASVMGGHYPAGGINLGPAMTFGYIAGRHAAGVTAWEGDVPHRANA